MDYQYTYQVNYSEAIKICRDFLRNHDTPQTLDVEVMEKTDIMEDSLPTMHIYNNYMVYTVHNVCEEIPEMPYEDGHQQGFQQGLEKTNRLNTLLLADKRYQDLKRSTTDPEYQKSMFLEYGL